jgi:hypothetical protein
MSIIETPLPEYEEAAPDVDVITAELVAKTIAGIDQIGLARRALEEAGHSAHIVANRITVGSIEAHLRKSHWDVFDVDGSPPVWTVGTQCHDASSWIGCVE